MQIVLLSTDLMLMSAAQGVVDRHGVELQIAANADAALAACGEAEASLLAIDLRARPLDIAALVASVRAQRTVPLHILAGGPHVQEASLAAARDAGCDEVVTRGQFEGRLDAAVARLVQ
jgi:DNA-binding response OmpR family regulator